MNRLDGKQFKNESINLDKLSGNGNVSFKNASVINFLSGAKFYYTDTPITDSEVTNKGYVDYLIQEVRNDTDYTNGNGLSLNNLTFSLDPNSNAYVINVNNKTGNVVLDTDDVNEGVDNLYNRQPNYEETDTNSPDFIKNKPKIRLTEKVISNGGIYNYLSTNDEVIIFNNIDEQAIIKSLSGSFDGKIIKIHNNSEFNLILEHEDLNSTISNRIISQKNKDVIVSKNTTVSLVYSGVLSRWTVESVTSNNLTDELLEKVLKLNESLIFKHDNNTDVNNIEETDYFIGEVEDYFIEGRYLGGTVSLLENYEIHRRTPINLGPTFSSVQDYGELRQPPDIIIGHNAGLTGSGFNNNIAIGPNSLRNDVNGFNTSVGINSLSSLLLGTMNVSYGYYSLNKLNIGDNNTSIGSNNAEEAIFVNNSTIIGQSSAKNNINISNSVFIGNEAGNSPENSNSDHNDVIFIGDKAGKNSINPINIISIGRNSLYNNSNEALNISNGIFIGKNTFSSSDGSINEIVVGHGQISKGSNTSLIGTPETEKIYLRGKPISDEPNKPFGERPILRHHTSIPDTLTSPGEKGDFAFDETHLYVCIEDNIWKRTLLNLTIDTSDNDRPSVEGASSSLIGLAYKTELLKGKNYIYVQANGTDSENGIELQEAYTEAKTRTPNSTNIITIVCGTGNYNFSNGDFVLDTPYINLVSLDGNKSIIFTGSKSISIEADNLFIKGINVLQREFKVNVSNLDNIVVENCKGGNYSFGRTNIISGTFINCIGGGTSFGYQGTLSGTFIDCVGTSNSFGRDGSITGSVIRCTSGLGSFGDSGIIEGVIKDCILLDGNYPNPTGEGEIINSEDGNGQIIHTYTTNEIHFRNIPGSHFGTATSPLTGAITQDLNKAKKGQIIKIYHDGGIEPSIPSTWKNSNQDIEYLANAVNENKVNVYNVEWDSNTRQPYWISQEQI